jgi:broad specificity phosphatase PhoE
MSKTVLIVSHGGVYSAFHAYFNNLPWEGNMRIGKVGNAEAVVYRVNNKKEVK